MNVGQFLKHLIEHNGLRVDEAAEKELDEQVASETPTEKETESESKEKGDDSGNGTDPGGSPRSDGDDPVPGIFSGGQTS